MSARIYKVTHGGQTSFVRAPTVNTAIRHIADRDIKAEVASQDDLIGLKKEDILVATPTAATAANGAEPAQAQVAAG